MPAFLIADIDITNPTTYEDYKQQVAPLIMRFGGRYLARGGRHEVLEGDWEPHRLVVLEVPLWPYKESPMPSEWQCRIISATLPLKLGCIRWMQGFPWAGTPADKMRRHRPQGAESAPGL